MKSYPLSLSPDYCSDWTAADSFREIVQNCLDSKADFHYSYDEHTETLTLTSLDTYLPASTLLLGNTSKRNELDSVGGYGEGYKIALLVLTRLGFEVVIKNGCKLWTPKYEYSDMFNSTALVIHEEDYGDSNDDLSFIVNGVDQDLWDEVVNNCTYLQEDLGEVLEGSTGRILKDKPGQLFVGGLFVNNTNLSCGYDFNPDVLKLNRDRKTVDSWDLEMHTARLWLDCGANDEVAEMLHNRVLDVSKTEYLTLPYEVSRACLSRFNSEYGDKYVVDCQSDKDELAEKGVTSDDIVVLDSAYTRAVRYSSDYKEPEIIEEDPEKTPCEQFEEVIANVEELIDFEAIKAQTVLDWFKELLEMFEEKGVKWQ